MIACLAGLHQWSRWTTGDITDCVTDKSFMCGFRYCSSCGKGQMSGVIAHDEIVRDQGVVPMEVGGFPLKRGTPVCLAKCAYCGKRIGVPMDATSEDVLCKACIEDPPLMRPSAP